MENWVDFKTVKEAISMRMVLDHYQINWLRKSGKELRGRCPIHKGEGTMLFTRTRRRMRSIVFRARRGATCWTLWPPWSSARSATRD